jgi:hypothetical protein
VLTSPGHEFFTELVIFMYCNITLYGRSREGRKEGQKERKESRGRYKIRRKEKGRGIR